MAEGRDAVVDYCLGLLREVSTEHMAADGAAPIALGVAAPGPVQPASGSLIDPPNLRGD
jgi:hypothetical protein